MRAGSKWGTAAFASTSRPSSGDERTAWKTLALRAYTWPSVMSPRFLAVSASSRESGCATVIIWYARAVRESAELRRRAP